MKAYIQQVRLGQLPEFPDDWLYAAFLGCKHMGIDAICFEDIMEVPKGQLVVSFVEDTIKYFERCGIEVPKPLNIPYELNKPEYIGSDRGYTVMKLSEFQENDVRLPVFVKSANKTKLFPAGVIQHKSSKKDLFHGIDGNEMVINCNVLDFVSEYRVFVLMGKPIGIKHYAGDYMIYPDNNFILKCIQEFQDCPVAYTLDIGVEKETGRNLVIECNDAWSIGNYGLDGKTYLKMLIARWQQITSFK